ncbi:hypothetical protein ANO11243_038590 [Dothideomycetidae sp. 11243]|nr:hypothetical protein ANO11243_038590 [fungal sp. No.11243]
MAFQWNNPQNYVAFGPGNNCTLEVCPIQASVYEYRPSLGANTIFVILFGIAMILHLLRGLRYREWFFTGAIVLGCICEMIGYGGRIMLWQNPFSFNGFLMQICCITFAPVFYCAAIYVLLTRVTMHLDPTISRVPPTFWYWFFIPCDLISLALQASGGALSTASTGHDNSAIDISLAGLGFQVGTLSLFVFGCLDYAIRYLRQPNRPPFTRQFKMLIIFSTVSILLIFIRCAYRINELKYGYNGPEITNQGEFIALESCMITIAAFTLIGANPGPAIGAQRKKETQLKKGAPSSGDSLA